MAVQKCKGMRDLIPAEMQTFRFIEGVFREVAENSGYREVRPPTLEYLHLFTSMGTLTPGMLRRVYSFLDWDGWSGERVVLRPDITIPVARMYLETAREGSLAKYYYVSNVFRFEPTGTKNRERWQCGVELIGASSSVADAELVRLALAVFQGLGLNNVTLRLSHAGLIRGLLRGLELDGRVQTELFDAVLEGNTAVLEQIDAARPELGRALRSLLELRGKSSPFLKNFRATYAANLTDLAPELENFISTADLFESLGAKCRIDIASGRGFEYYTGIMFQFLAGKEHVASGGRYDDLIPLVGGTEVPASGLALNLNPLLDLVQVAAPATDGRVLVRVTPDRVKDGFEMVSRLQAQGQAAEIDLGGQDETAFAWVVEAGDGTGYTLIGGGKAQPLDNPEAVLQQLKNTGPQSN